MQFLENVSLKKYSRYQIGGPADFFAQIKSKEELIDALSSWKKINPEMNNLFIMGGGTNILFNDDGFRGLVIKIDINFIEKNGDELKVGAGVLFADLVSRAATDSLSGLEWAGGLPGTVGGAVRGNAGAFMGETKDNLIEIESLDVNTLEIKKRNNKECDFNYRNSIFKSGVNEIVLSATYKLKKGDPKKIKEETQAKIDFRIDRHPLDLPNIGSTFKNVPLEQVKPEVRDEFKDSIKNDPFRVIPVAKLLVALNLKGRVIGGAKFSEKHPNFIVNFNNAKAKDVLDLIALAKKEVKAKYSISLEEEIMVV